MCIQVKRLSKVDKSVEKPMQVVIPDKQHKSILGEYSKSIRKGYKYHHN